MLSKMKKGNGNNNKNHGVTCVRVRGRFFLYLMKIAASYSSLAAGTPAHLNIINLVTSKKICRFFQT